MGILSSSVIDIMVLKYFSTNYANNLCKTSVKGREIVLFKNKKNHNLETLKWIKRKLVHCQTLHYWWVMERFLVCHPNVRGVPTQIVTPE